MLSALEAAYTEHNMRTGQNTRSFSLIIRLLEGYGTLSVDRELQDSVITPRYK